MTAIKQISPVFEADISRLINHKVWHSSVILEIELFLKAPRAESKTI